MSSRQSRLEAEKLAIIQKSMSRGRSRSPSNSNSRSSSTLNDDFNNKDMKWSITNHDPLERLRDPSKSQEEEDAANALWDNEVSEEEHISDDDENEKFQYDGTGNILPNYACQDEKILEISTILQNSNLNDRQTIKKL